MDAKTVENRFLKVNRAFGILTGVWPYQGASFKLMERVAAVTIMSTSLLTQTAFHISFPSLDGALMSMPYYIAALGTFVKMGNYFLNENKLKSVINCVFDDWAAIKSEEEYDIMITYSQKGLYLSIIYILHVAAAVTLMISWPFVTIILDLVKPLNKSRERTFIYPAYYGLDAEKYHVLILLHMIICWSMLCCIYCACDTNYVYAVQHACGLLAITRNRFITVNKYLSDFHKKSNSRLLENVGYQSVCNSIKAHQHAIKYLMLLERNHHTYMFITMGMLILIISLSLLQVANNRQTEWVVQYMFLFAQLFHAFILIVQGQFVINGFNDVYNSVYESPWYTLSPETQALYVLSLRSCLNPPLLTAGGLIILNLRSFAELVKASVSYYTVMQTT